MPQLTRLSTLLQTLSLYRPLRQDPVLTSFQTFLTSFSQKQEFATVVNQYTEFCSLLYQSEQCANLHDHVLTLVLRADNKFTQGAAGKALDTLPEALTLAAKQDLSTLHQLATLSFLTIQAELSAQYQTQQFVIQSLPRFTSKSTAYSQFADWSQLDTIVAYHETHGTGQFAQYYAFYFADSCKLMPIVSPRVVHLEELKKYEVQKQKVIDNTKSFLAGKPSNNVLLYGDRGTGKSTLVHAILNTFEGEGLRMIQIVKDDILYLDRLIAQIRDLPLRFIIFIDDLTFNENDPSFNSLKAILEGSLNVLPPHVCIYATTNRRHLIKETFSAREGNELHASDTRDESASLADRFGLCLTFMKPTLPEYLDMVCAMAADRKLPVDTDTLKRGATTFATRKGNRSGRVARQFIDDLEGRLALNLPI